MNAIMMYVLPIIFTLFVLFPTQGYSAPMTSNIRAARKIEKNPGDMLRFCKNDNFQSSFKGPDDKQYYFHVHQVYVVNKNNVAVFKRNDIFSRSPYLVDAMVYSHRTGKAYLFKDHKVWIYQYRGHEFTYTQTKRLDRTSPHTVEAAFSYRESIYLLRDGYLYEWSENNNNVIPNHVFPTRYFWEDVPQKVDAIMQDEDSSKTVFWKRQGLGQMEYYLFDNSSRKLIKRGSYASFFPFCAR